MHNAPAVQYPLGRSRFLAGLLLLLWLFAAAVVMTWLVLQQALWTWRAMGLALLPMTAWACLHWWHARPKGSLQWDGQHWHLSDAGGSQSGRLRIHLDWQAHLLLAWRGAASARVVWLWLDRADQPLLWDELRRAVYSRASATAHVDAHSASTLP